MKSYLAALFGILFGFGALLPATAEARSERGRHSSETLRTTSSHRHHWKKSTHHRKHSHRVYRRGHHVWHHGHRVWVPARYVIIVS